MYLMYFERSKKLAFLINVMKTEDIMMLKF